MSEQAAAQACLPGSHLDGATIGPPGQEKLVVAELSTEGVPQPRSFGDWTTPPWPAELPVRGVHGQPGQAVLFVERLVHATLPWKGRGERRSLFYSAPHHLQHHVLSTVDARLTRGDCAGTEYVQRGMHYQDRIYDRDAPGLSEEQRQVLSLPPVWHNESRHHRSPFTAPPEGLEGGAAKL